MNEVDRERLDVARVAVTRLIEGIRTIRNEPRDREDVHILALLEEASSALGAAEILRSKRIILPSPLQIHPRTKAKAKAKAKVTR